eukprot:761772-Hanusia_phi.AAC.3
MSSNGSNAREEGWRAGRVKGQEAKEKGGQDGDAWTAKWRGARESMKRATARDHCAKYRTGRGNEVDSHKSGGNWMQDIDKEARKRCGRCGGENAAVRGGPGLRHKFPGRKDFSALRSTTTGPKLYKTRQKKNKNSMRVALLKRLAVVVLLPASPPCAPTKHSSRTKFRQSCSRHLVQSMQFPSLTPRNHLVP